MNNLRRLRLKRNLTQDQLASDIGVTAKHISFLENEERSPSLNIAYKFADYFECNIEDIFPPKKCTKCTSI